MSVFLHGAWRLWKLAARATATVLARVLFTLFYFTVLGPFALCVRCGGDPLAVKAGTERGWRPARAEQLDMEQAKRQF